MNIFISYRRSESSGYSGRIYDRLRAALPDADVFIDVERIDPGTDWRVRLAERIRAAQIVLVLIGPEWRSAADATGARRIDDPNDVTRWEIESALAAGKRIVPILLDDVPPLQPHEVPPALAPLCALQAVRLRHDAFDAGIEDLIARLTGRRLRDEARSAAARLRIERAKRWAIPAIAVLVVLAAWTRLFDLLALDTRIATWTLAIADAVAPLALDPSLALVAIEPEHDARDPAMRARYGEAIAALAAAGARRIVLDIHFHEPRASDAALAQAMREARSRGAEVFFSFVAAAEGKPRAVAQLAQAASGTGLACVGRRLGYTHTVALAYDIREDGGRWRAASLPSLALLGAAGAARIQAIDPDAATLAVDAGGELHGFRYSVLGNEVSGTQGCPAMTPGTRTAELLVRMVPPAALHARRIAMKDLLSGRVERSRISAKTVVMGFETADESFRVAHGLARTSVFGYELHANAINMLAAGRSPRFAPPVAQGFIAAFFASLGAILGVRLSRRGRSVTATVCISLAVVYFGLAVAIAAAEDVLLKSAYDVSAFAIAFLLFHRMAKRWLQ